MEKLIKRINELAHLAKTRDLTPAELEERQNLRNEYIQNFRAGFKQRLENIKVVDEQGNDITPKKAKS